MQLVLYDADTLSVLDVIKDVQNPVVDKNSVSWNSGALGDAKVPFLILDNGVAIEESVTQELLNLNRSSEFSKVDLAKENEELRERLRIVEDAVVSLMDFI
jgi:hypothetical protein